MNSLNQIQPALEARFQGALLGLALGDALGAPHEGGVIERMLWQMIGRTREGYRRWTDDTQMSLDLVDSLNAQNGFDADDIARRFATGYRWSRGYGPGAAKVLKRIARGEDWRHANRAVYPEGSYGNGGAMRAPAIGLFLFERPDDLPQAVMLVSSITHAHPLAIEGALLIARATAMSVAGVPTTEILDQLVRDACLEPYVRKLATAAAWLASGAAITPRVISASLGNGIAASDSCVTALYVAFRFAGQPFRDMQKFVIHIGGDVDTIGAMAGAIWGAAHGVAALPSGALAKLEQRQTLMDSASALFRSVVDQRSIPFIEETRE
jgi:poly(ADP-ribose) glycohydrolase ARH3